MRHFSTLVLAGLLGCPGTDSDSDTDPATPDGFAPLLLEGSAETGVLLGAYSGSSGDAVLVGGDFSGIGRVVRYDGDAFCVDSETTDGILWWVHGTGADDWTAVGQSGIVIRSEDGAQTRDDIPTNATLFGVYDDGTDLWAVGGDVANTQEGEIWRKPEGGDWTLVAGELDGLMFKVWNGWFVGDGLAFQWNGSELVAHPPPNEARLTTVTGPPGSDGSSDVWAVGGDIQQVLLEWNGSDWVEHPVDPLCGGGQGLNGVWTDGTTVWIAGHNGAAASYDGETFTCDQPPLTFEHFHAAWHHAPTDEVLFLGGNLFNSTDNIGVVAAHRARQAGPLEVSACE